MARAVLDRPPPLLGWRTTDDDEIALRRWRGRTEIVAIEALEPKQPFFGTFRVQSGSGGFYEVEIRDLDGFNNSCGCIDHRANGLGTCKHIEGVLAALRQRSAKAFREAAARGSPRVEVFLDRRGAATPALMWPAGDRRHANAASRWLAPFIEPDGTLACDPSKVEALVSAWRVAPADIRRRIRVSRHFTPWLDRLRRERSREEARAAFLAEVKDGAASFDLLRHPLLPYQREGMLHLAFGERTLLADEMGLGKTVQAIAACELLARRKGIERVLVVCPASLKAEWEEQIARFTDRPARSVFGARPARLAAYREPTFFTIVNYEQVLGDAPDINEILRPDVVVLDEAQRIKNWQIKTARRVKSLRSPYAFVLTGTPVENRIDELYSIVQYLDPELVGPLFRFNRDFYELDERGRPVDYKNLAELRRRLQPVMLRRRKSDVESELPGRTVKTYFVPMVEEQKLRYEDYSEQAARLLAQAQRRPLTPKEFERLQMLLACMRMICDTPAILDPTCRVSPKLEELEGILSDLLEEPERKIIVFSEWERMLEMVRELAGGTGRGCGLAHRLGAAAAPPRRDRSLQAGPRLPAVPLHRQRQRRAQSAGRERGRERRPAVEPGEARAAHRARLAQEPDAFGDGRQSRLRGFDRAPDSASSRSQAGAGRRRARRPRRSRRAQDAVRPGGHDRAHAGDDAGGGERHAAHPVAGRSRRRRVAASPRRAGAADRGPHRRRWPCPPAGRPRPRRRSARRRGETARGAP